MTLREYLDASRRPRYSVLFAVPLLVAYEALAWLLADSAGGVRNGADVLLKWLFLGIGGRRGLLVFDGLLLAIAAVLVVRDLRRSGGRLSPRVFLAMLGESVGLALLVGVVVGQATRALLRYLSVTGLDGLGLGTQVMLSLGAGIYEELLFRVLLVGALAALARRGFGWGPGAAVTFATILGALVFSAFHYIGPYGDAFTLQTFTFRALAGLVFSALYLTRGFGIAAWTHALYDVFVTLA